LQIPTPGAQTEITETLASAAAAAAAKLPLEDQNYIAWRIMEEIAEEQKWTDSFTGSPDVLDQMATESLQEHAEGKIRPLEELL